MPRVVPADLAAALQQAVVSPFRAVELFFPSGTLRFWTGTGERNIRGDVYYGVAPLLQFVDAEESGAVEANGSKVGMSGITPDLLAMALKVNYQGSVANLYFGEKSVASSMIHMGSGTVDQMPIDDDASSVMIWVTIENILIDLDRPRVMRYTHQDQQLLHPGDKIFEFVADIQDAQIKW